QKGKTIYGLNSITDSLVFHAGTLPDGPSVVSNGGRVLAVTSYGKNLESALERSYESIAKITFEDAYFRTDIGKDVIEK
ncbi:MAG: phosphoribosylglycinamide synthetase C domain-containing protein, partial [Flavobacteriia bacterium]